MYWKLPQRSFFGRIQDAIICFWDLLTFSIRILRNLKLPNLLRYHIISSLIFRFLMKWKYSWFPSICFGFFPYLNQSKLHFLVFRKIDWKKSWQSTRLFHLKTVFANTSLWKGENSHDNRDKEQCGEKREKRSQSKGKVHVC